MTPVTVARGAWHAVQAGMFSWYKVKMFVEHAAIVTSDALHVLVGVALWVIAGLLLRRPLTSWFPWLWVLAAILCNETVDLWVEQWPMLAMQYGESAKDIMLTLSVPTVLMLLARSRPSLFARGSASAPRRRRR